MAEDQARIQEILAGLSQTQQPGLAQRLLSGIPEALAILFSPNPTELLQRQIERKDVSIEREKERRERVKQLGAQLQIEDILQRGKERRSEEAMIRAEGRAETRGIAAETRQDLRDIARFERESGFQEGMLSKQHKNAKELLEIKNIYEVENARTQFTNSVFLENLRSSNNLTQQKIGNELQFVLPLLYSGNFSGKDAANIYDKIARGEKLSPDEDKRISQANKSLRNEEYRNRLAIAYAQHRGEGGVESMITKGIQWAQTRAGATDLGMDAQGNIHKLRPNPLTGEGTALDPNVKITKFLSEKEQFEYYYNQLPISKVQPLGGQATNLPDEKALSLKLDSIIQEAREKDKLSDNQIIENLNNPQVQQKLGITPQLVQEAITRNKLQSASQSQLTPASFSATTTAGGEVVGNIAEGPSPETQAALKKAEEDKRKSEAVKTVNYLQARLRTKENLLKRPETTKLSKENIQMDVKDLKRRLEDAYNAHPELRPK